MLPFQFHSHWLYLGGKLRFFCFIHISISMEIYSQKIQPLPKFTIKDMVIKMIMVSWFYVSLCFYGFMPYFFMSYTLFQFSMPSRYWVSLLMNISEVWSRSVGVVSSKRLHVPQNPVFPKKISRNIKRGKLNVVFCTILNNFL